MDRLKSINVKKIIKDSVDVKQMAETLYVSVLFHQQPVSMLISSDTEGLYYISRLKNYSAYKINQLKEIRRSELWKELAKHSINYLYYSSYLITKIEEEKTGQIADGLFKKTKRVQNIINQESINLLIKPTTN